MSTDVAIVTNQLQGVFSRVKDDHGDYEHFLGKRCIEDFIEEQLQYIRPGSNARVVIEAVES